MRKGIAAVLLVLASFALARQTSPVCDICMRTVSGIHWFLGHNTTLSVGEMLFTPFCLLAFDGQFCEKLYNNMFRVYFLGVLEGLRGDVVCGRMGMCRSPRIVELPYSQYVRRMLKDKPPSVQPPLKTRSKPIRFVVFTDIHVDFHYQEGSSGICNSFLCCRNSSGPPANASVAAGKFGYPGFCCLPEVTLRSFLNHTISEIKPDFFIWLGDNPDQHIWDQHKYDHLDGIKLITKLLKEGKYDHQGTVYPVLGNHEGLPCDSLDLDGETHKWVIQNTSRMWKDWLTREAYEEYRSSGSYTMLHPGTNLRIVGLNPFTHDNLNTYIWKNLTNPLGILDWLNMTLYRAEQSGEAVLLLDHFPVNSRAITKEFGVRFASLLERYTNTIRACMYGHNHEDVTEIMYSFADGSPVSVGFLNPALTTYHHLNPSFRVYEMDPDNFAIKDFEQHRLYLHEANKKNKPIWRVAYRYTTFYGVNRPDHRAAQELAGRFYSDRTVREKMMRMYYAETPRWKSLVDHEYENRYFYCKMTSSHYFEMDDCMGGHYESLEDVFRFRILMRYLQTEWKLAVYDDQL